MPDNGWRPTEELERRYQLKFLHIKRLSAGEILHIVATVDESGPSIYKKMKRRTRASLRYGRRIFPNVIPQL